MNLIPFRSTTRKHDFEAVEPRGFTVLQTQLTGSKSSEWSEQVEGISLTSYRLFVHLFALGRRRAAFARGPAAGVAGGLGVGALHGGLCLPAIVSVQFIWIPSDDAALTDMVCDGI